MPFCPVPHTSRDQAWLVLGALAGTLVVWIWRGTSWRAALGEQRSHIWLIVEFSVQDPSGFFGAFNPLSAASLKEPGCLRYELLKEAPGQVEGHPIPLDSSRFTLVEEYTSQEALDAHNASDHFKIYVPQLGRAAQITLRKLHTASC